MNPVKLLEKLKDKFNVKSDQELSDLSGISQPTISQWRNNKENLSESSISNFIFKASEKGKENFSKSAILPIVEMYPITHTESKQKAKWEILPMDENVDPYAVQLKSYLKSAKGIYLFYNSEGKVLYAGKTEKNLWDEINNAFNRKRPKQQAFFVSHPSRVDFTPAYEKPRKPKCNLVALHDIAYYFSAYKVDPLFIKNVEAFLIRAFPNDLSNVRMESFKEG